MNHQILVPLPPGVACNQLPNNVVRLHFNADTVVPLQGALLKAAGGLLDTAIAAVTARKDAELARQQLPASRLEQIDQEMAELEKRRAEVLAMPVPSAQQLGKDLLNAALPPQHVPTVLPGEVPTPVTLQPLPPGLF